MSEAQLYLKKRDEFDRVLDNYTILVDKARELDPSAECNTGRLLQHIISGCYIPKLQKQMKLLLSPQDQDKFQPRLDKLVSKEDKTSQIKYTPGSYENPLTLLLSLAIEKGDIRDDRETQSEENNWGRLGNFHGYLKSLEFKFSTNKEHTQYWPGLPYCVMALIPIWCPKEKYKISVSASPDQFPYLPAMNIFAFNRRKDRMESLRKSCHDKTNKRIDEMIEFSKTLRGDHYSEKLWMDSSKLQEDANYDKHNNRLYSWKPYDLKSHKDWPVYLPVVVSTWKPDGQYLRACPLDRVRFITLRPPAAERAETTTRQRKKSSKESKSNDSEIPAETSCAEWMGFLNWISQQEDSTATWY